MSTYTTKQGDMWDGIAYLQLGSTDYTGDLMRVNSQYLDYYTFPAGIALVIPDVQKTETVTAAPPWKRVSG